MTRADLDDPAFLRLLRTTPSASLRSLLTPYPTPTARRALQRALRGSTGGEAQARRTLLHVHAAHGLPGPDHLITTLARRAHSPPGHGRSLLAPLLVQPRHHLHAHLLQAAAWLAQQHLPFDYPALYTDLKYHTTLTTQQWCTLAHQETS